MNFSKYPSIDQFRHVCKSVERSYKYTLNVSTGEWEYDISKVAPILTFIGTVKIHGTNAGIYVDKDGNINAQKRSCAVGDEGGHFGFSEWLASSRVKQAISEIRTNLLTQYKILENKDFVIYLEWCGGNIQSGVAITGLDKMAAVFGVKIIESKEEELNHWLDITDFNFTNIDVKLYDIRDFGTYSIDIDFMSPTKSVPALQKLTEEVEAVCPVGKYFGVSGIGEGIVWSHMLDDGSVLKFKVKGEKHSGTKVKVLASVDIEKLESIDKFVEYALTESRLKQAATETLDVMPKSESGLELKYDFDRSKLGKFLKWVSTDIVKEESDSLLENNLDMSMIGSTLNKTAKKWFFEQETL